MKMSGDTLLFVFECEDGYGQQLLRRAVIDNSNNTISISLDMGKREDGYYTSYMPYPLSPTMAHSALSGRTIARFLPSRMIQRLSGHGTI